MNQTIEILATHPHIEDVYIATDDVQVYQHLQLHFDPKVCDCCGHIWYHMI